MTTTTAPITVGADLADLADSFELSLRAANKAPRTIEVYGESLRQLIAFLRAAGMPTEATRLTREHVELFEVDLLARGRKAATVSVRHRALQAFFKWCVAVSTRFRGRSSQRETA